MFGFIGIIVAIVIFFLFSAIKILPEYQRGVVLTLGRYTGTKGPGLILLIPVVQRIIRVDLRVNVMDVPPQDVITYDNVSIRVNAVVYFRVVDSDKSVLQVADFYQATSQLAQTRLRAMLGQHELDEILSQRDSINHTLQEILDEATDAWGIKISNVEIKDVDINETMVRAIARQAEAERERRAKVIHADIDPAEISKNRHADVPIVGDLKDVLVDRAAELEREQAQHGRPDVEGWWATLDRLRETYPLGWTPTEDGLLAPQHVISRLGEISGPESIYVAGVGQHQMWAAQFIRYQHPRTWLNSGGLGTMGYSVPAAMGAQVGRPDATVWAIDGDGCFQMTNQELATCALEGIPIKVAIINNSSLGMVRQWQTLFYDQRYSNTDLNTGHQSARIPDFVKLAEAHGCVGLRCEKVADVDATIRKAEEIDDRPVVVDFVVSADAMVWPMVAAGVSNDDIQYARGISPAFERDE